MPKRIDLENYIVQTCDFDYKISSSLYKYRTDREAIDYFYKHYTDTCENNFHLYLLYAELLRIDKFTGEYVLLHRVYF